MLSKTLFYLFLPLSSTTIRDTAAADELNVSEIGDHGQALRFLRIVFAAGLTTSIDHQRTETRFNGIASLLGVVGYVQQILWSCLTQCRTNTLELVLVKLVATRSVQSIGDVLVEITLSGRLQEQSLPVHWARGVSVNLDKLFEAPVLENFSYLRIGMRFE